MDESFESGEISLCTDGESLLDFGAVVSEW